MSDNEFYDYEEEEKEKKSLRYSNSGIVSVILIISILSLVLSFFLEKSDIFSTEDSYNRYINGIFPSAISNSLYDNEDEDYYYPNDFEKDAVKYAVRGLKVENFDKTEEFKTRYPYEVVIRDLNGKIETRMDRSSYEELRNEYPEYQYTTNIDSPIEAPVEGMTFLSNIDDVDENTDPQKLKIDDKKSVYTIKGYYEDGKVNITSQKLPEKKYEEFSKAFKKSLNKTYRGINDSYYGIKKLNFVYSIDLNSKAFNNYLVQENWERSTLPSKMIATLIGIAFFVAFVMISNYKKLKDVSFAEGIKRFPVEVVMIFTGLWFIPPAVITEMGFNKSSLSVSTMYSIQFIMMFFALIAIYYYILGFKSIYNEGSKSFVFSNSIIVRIIKSILHFIRNTILKAAKYSQENLDVTSNALSKLRVICIVLAVLGTFTAMTVVKSGLLFVIWVIWMAFILLIYTIFKKYMQDLDNVTQKSKIISEGNFDVKIDEETTYFKGIAHSFNTISDNLSTAVEEAVKSERLKSELITNVSHDLKTPLTSIINYSDLIVKENTTDEEKDEYAEIIYEKSLKLKNLIEDLFEVSKASSGNIDLNLEEIDFRAILMQISGEWEDKFEDRHLQIVQTLPEEPIILNLDGNRTSRVLDNLFSNIYKYAMPGTRVYVDLEKNENEIVLLMKNISNYSLNISSDELVDRFKRGDESRNTEGSGLGLSIATSLIEAQGGKFNIDIDGDLFKTEIKF